MARPSTTSFSGPVLWSPSLEPPSWWHEPPAREGGVYVTLGSSGRVDRLPVALRGLARLGVPLLVATAGRCSEEGLGEHVLAADYLPGAEAARRAPLVVCNGGSSTGYQALAEGCPVLGIASNLDQYLAMTAIRDRGAGILLRASTLTEQAVEQAARTILEQPSYALAAEQARQELRKYDCGERFLSAMARVAPV